MLALFLCACGDGAISVSGAPVPPAEPPPSVPAAANAVFVANPADGEILARVGQPRVFILEFRASEGIAAGLRLSLPSIPGWGTVGDTLNCRTVDSAGTCRLQAVYTPTAPLASSNMQFSYAYTDNTGAARDGAYSLAYRVLPANTVVASQQPGGVLRGVVGRLAPVMLEFDTSDGEPATSLEVSASLAALPAGWKSEQAEFACAGLGQGQPCRLALSYSPALPTGKSALDLAYRYLDSSGAPRTGTARVDYSATLAGTVSASLNASTPLVVKPGGKKEITVRFAASDGVRAGALYLSTDPANTPGWSVKPGWQGCATVEGNDSCSLTLVFAPTVVLGPGALSLTYTYLNNIGEARSGSMEIAYSSRVYEAYIADYGEDNKPGGVRLCTINADGSLANCTPADVELPAGGRGISHALASGRQAYVASLAVGDQSSVFLCAIAADGALKDCGETGAIRTGVRRVFVRGASVYLLTGDGKILRQDVDAASGEIVACPSSRGICQTESFSGTKTALAFAGADAYLTVQFPSNEILGTQCTIMSTGDFDCSRSPFLSARSSFTDNFSTRALAIYLDGTVSRIYLVGEPSLSKRDGNHYVIQCNNSNNATEACEITAVATFSESLNFSFRDITFDGNHAYIVDEKDVYLCGVNASDGKLTNSTPLGGTGAARHFALSINRID